MPSFYPWSFFIKTKCKKKICFPLVQLSVSALEVLSNLANEGNVSFAHQSSVAGWCQNGLRLLFWGHCWFDSRHCHKFYMTGSLHAIVFVPADMFIGICRLRLIWANLLSASRGSTTYIYNWWSYSLHSNWLSVNVNLQSQRKHHKPLPLLCVTKLTS